MPVVVRDAVSPDLTGLVAYLAGAEVRSGAAQ